MVVEHHKKCGLFSDFHYGFRSSQSTLDLLTVVSDRLTSAFDRSVTWYITVAIVISKGFYRVWHTGLFQKLISYRISGWLFFLSSVMYGFDWIWMESLLNNIQLMLQFFKIPFLCLPNSYYTLITLLMTVSVILLYILKILPSIPGVIKHLMWGNN